jgi:hypothetical protein
MNSKTIYKKSEQIFANFKIEISKLFLIGFAGKNLIRNNIIYLGSLGLTS